MRLRGVVLALIALGLAVAGADSTRASDHSSAPVQASYSRDRTAAASVHGGGLRYCRRVRDVVPGGRPIGAMKIRARGVGCRVARALPRRYLREVNRGNEPPVRVGSWLCDDFYSRWPYPTLCTAGAKRVRWRLYRR